MNFVFRSLIEKSRRSSTARSAFRWMAPEKRREIMRALGGMKRVGTVRAALEGRTGNLSDIEAFLVAKAEPLRLPLVLVSQVQRSGGTLLSQLFDGHPAFAAHPHELKIGYPTPDDWPPLEPALGAEANFRMLFEVRTIRFLKQGYTKGERGSEVWPFFNVPRLQAQIFSELFRTRSPQTPREILDFFFTAYFRAWLNYHGDLEHKRYVTGFSPRFADNESNVASFFNCYPDGWLIQIIRDPRSWFPSAKHHGRAGIDPNDIGGLLSAWTTSTEASLRNKALHGDRVIILSFDNLVGRTEETMRRLAAQLGVDFGSALLVPSFNGQTMTANSSFPVDNAGVLAAPLKREKLLSSAERDYINRNCISLYEQAIAFDVAS